MTTATPTLDPTAEPLLDEPDRRVCELWNNHGGPTTDTCRFVRCARPADWVMHVSYPCGHHGTEARLVCSPCKAVMDRDGDDIGCGQDGSCWVKAEVRWQERIR